MGAHAKERGFISAAPLTSNTCGSQEWPQIRPRSANETHLVSPTTRWSSTLTSIRARASRSLRVTSLSAWLGSAPVERLTDPAELDLLKRLALYPRMVESAAVAHEPHRIAFYLYDLASEFHALWTKGRDLPYLRFIITNDAQITRARLAMVQGVVSVLASGLAVLGVHAPTEMR